MSLFLCVPQLKNAPENACWQPHCCALRLGFARARLVSHPDAYHGRHAGKRKHQVDNW